MNAPGKGMLKVTSILFIIFGAIATIVSILGLIGAGMISAVTMGATAILTVAMVLLLLVSVAELVIGIIGIKKSGDPTKAMFFVVTGIILCVLTLVSMIMSFQVTSLIGFVLPVLYIIGGFMNKNATAKVEAPPAA